MIICPKNTKLAIAIPTYNRAEILKENILLMLNDIKEFSIPVYISDDSTDDSVGKVIDGLKKEYEYIYYSKNSPSLGHDLNCIKTFNLVSEDYVWYLGDSIIIKPGSIRKVLDVIEKCEYDFISVNEEARNFDTRDKVYRDGNELLVDLGWHLTMTGTVIYEVKKLKTSQLNLAKCRYFPQEALVFINFIADKQCLYWISEKLIRVNRKKISWWVSVPFSVFLSDWNDLIMNLPSAYTLYNKNLTIKKHIINTKMFTPSYFWRFRFRGKFSFKIFAKYFGLFYKHCDTNILLIFFISIFPRPILGVLRKIRIALK